MQNVVKPLFCMFKMMEMLLYVMMMGMHFETQKHMAGVVNQVIFFWVFWVIYFSFSFFFFFPLLFFWEDVSVVNTTFKDFIDFVPTEYLR